MDSGSALRTARAARGKTQRQLAADVGTHQPHIAAIETGAHDTTVSGLERHLQALLYRLTVLPTRRRPAWEAALDVADHLSAADEASAFREILQLSDELAQSSADIRVALVVTPPPGTKDARFDALLAGVGLRGSMNPAGPSMSTGSWSPCRSCTRRPDKRPHPRCSGTAWSSPKPN